MTKPKSYIINLGDGTYYSEEVAWKGVEKESATKLTHKEAYIICNKLKQPRIGYKASVETT